MDPLASFLEFSRLSLHSKSTNEYLMNYFSIIRTLKGVYITYLYYILQTDQSAWRGCGYHGNRNQSQGLSGAGIRLPAVNVQL